MGTDQHNLSDIIPTSSEIGHLQSIYLAESMSVCFLKNYDDFVTELLGLAKDGGKLMIEAGGQKEFLKQLTAESYKTLMTKQARRIKAPMGILHGCLIQFIMYKVFE